jgi:hypothetical protein
MWSRGGDRRSLRKIWSDELRLSLELVIWIWAVGLMIDISERDEEAYIDLKSKQNCQSLMKEIHMASMGHDDVALKIVLDFCLAHREHSQPPGRISRARVADANLNSLIWERRLLTVTIDG